MASIELVTLDIERLDTPHSVAPMRLANYLLHKSKIDNININPLISSYSINENSRNIAERIVEGKPDFIGLPGYIWTIEKSSEISNYVHKLNLKTIVVVGGPEVVLPEN